MQALISPSWYIFQATVVIGLTLWCQIKMSHECREESSMVACRLRSPKLAAVFSCCCRVLWQSSVKRMSVCSKGIPKIFSKSCRILAISWHYTPVKIVSWLQCSCSWQLRGIYKLLLSFSLNYIIYSTTQMYINSGIVPNLSCRVMDGTQIPLHWWKLMESCMAVGLPTIR